MTQQIETVQPTRPEITEKNKPFSCRGGALQLWKCRDPRIVIEGPACTGKSKSVLEKMHYMATRYPGMRALLCRKTRASMTESVLVEYENSVVPRAPWVTSNQRKVRQAYQYPNGSSVVVAGLDNPDRIMSTQYDLIVVCEATELTLNDFELLVTRNRNYCIRDYQQIILDCNPSRPSHWINLAANKGVLTRIKSRLEDNPLYHDGNDWTKRGKAYRESLQMTLTGVRYARLFEGRWAAAEGLVYEEYDPDIHLLPNDRIPNPFQHGVPRSWRKFRSIDFGYNHPFVCLWGCLDPDDNLYIYREIHKRHRIVEDHARDIRLYTGLEEIEFTCADHDREDRETLHRHGVQTIAARKEIMPGIEAVRVRLRVHKDQPRPRLYFLRDMTVEKDENPNEGRQCNSLIDELESYSNRRDVEGKLVKDEPEKINDDACDALRYMVAEIDGLGPARVNKFRSSPVAAVPRS